MCWIVPQVQLAQTRLSVQLPTINLERWSQDDAAIRAAASAMASQAQASDPTADAAPGQTVRQADTSDGQTTASDGEAEGSAQSAWDRLAKLAAERAANSTEGGSCGEAARTKRAALLSATGLRPGQADALFSVRVLSMKMITMCTGLTLIAKNTA